MISDSSSHSMPYVFLLFFTQHSFVKISLSGILIGVSVQIFPFAVLKGFSRNDCFVHSFISANPEITRISNLIWDNFRLYNTDDVYNKNLEKWMFIFIDRYTKHFKCMRSKQINPTVKSTKREFLFARLWLNERRCKVRNTSGSGLVIYF